MKLPDGRVVQSTAVSSSTLRGNSGKTPGATKPRSKSQRCGKSKVRRSQSSSSGPKHAEVRRVCRSVNKNDTDHGNDSTRRVWGASHKGQAINQWQVCNMNGALNEWHMQKDSNVSPIRPLREIARAWGIPYATFRRRVISASSAHRADHQSGRPTVLSKSAENELAVHIRQLAAAGFPCDRSDVKNLAYEYAVKNGLTGFSVQKKTAGYYWFRGFLRRHSDLIMKKAENLSVPRAMSMNRQQVLKWFDTYQTLATDLGIIDLPTHIWNTDETGCQNIHTANSVVGVVGKPSYNLTAMEKGETSTALITINAVGDSAPVMIVHKGKNVGKQWSNGAPRDTLVRVSEKGYINKELFFEFGKLFVKHLKDKNLVDGRPHLLLLDSHYSHLYNLEFLSLMKENNIHVFAIPPHTSHWLQPLDRGVFSSFKSAWQHEMRLFTRSTAGRKLDKKDFFVVFTPAYTKSLTVENCQGAFRGTGIFPCNPAAIPSHAFEPSSTSERELVSPSVLPTESTAVSSHPTISAATPSEEVSAEILKSVPSEGLTSAGSCQQATESVGTCGDVPSSSRCVNLVEGNSTTSEAFLAEVLPLSESGNQLATVFTTSPVACEVLPASGESGSQSETADCRSFEEPPVAQSLSSSECSNQLIAEEAAASKDDVLPGLYGSVNQLTKFEELMPLPKRHRPSSKRILKKPPSYELTGASTMQFVRESAEKKGKRSQKCLENKAKKAKVEGQVSQIKIKRIEGQRACESKKNVNDKDDGEVKAKPSKKNTITRSGYKQKKSPRKKTEDKTKKKGTEATKTYCLVCGDDHEEEAWIQCNRCQEWAHEECADITDVDFYHCDNCK